MKVAICAKNSARWGISLFAINSYEAVAVPILADFHPESVNALVDHSESIALMTDNDIWKKLDINKMPNVKAVVSTNDFSLLYSAKEDITAAFSKIDDTFKAKYPNGFGKDDVCYPDGNDKDLAIINYTSGTTSAPKGVMLRYECISANVEFGQTNLPSYPGDKIVSMLPMAHMYGMMFECIYPLCGGSSVYYLGKTPTPALLLAAMAEVKPYLMITVPLVMEKVFKTNIYGVEIMFTTDESDESTARTVDDVKAVIAEKIEESSSVNVAKASIFACLDLCDERNKARDEVEKLREEVLRLSKKEQDARDDRKEALALKPCRIWSLSSQLILLLSLFLTK